MKYYIAEIKTRPGFFACVCVLNLTSWLTPCFCRGLACRLCGTLLHLGCRQKPFSSLFWRFGQVYGRITGFEGNKNSHLHYQLLWGGVVNIEKGFWMILASTFYNFSCLFSYTSRENLGDIGSTLPLPSRNLFASHHTDAQSISCRKIK